jgi:prepilin-type N-terminal cleavage/methylation domain-containing protein
MKNKQSGFTLIEIAIVLVIIGLLLGGVLKGQELINSARVKNLATDFKNVPIYIYGYQDKFKALPGDDANAQLHLGTTAVQAATVAGSQTIGNGIIEGAWNSTTNTDESYLFWQHIRLAGFGPGSTDTSNTAAAQAAYLPTNTVGGRIGVTNSVTNNPITLPNPLQGTYIVCSDNVPGKFAMQLDTTLDDGNTQTGSVMVLDPAGTALTSVATATIGTTPDKPYTVCMGY